MKRLFILCLIALLFFPGCALFRSKEQKLAPELASDGMDQFKSGNYRSSIESFETLKNWYPFSKYAILAELKIGDAYYKLKEYEEAIFAYEEFENLHPRNEAVPYVIYQIGLSYFEQIDTRDRDQAPARKALDTFHRLVKQFPTNPYAIKSAGLIKKSLKSIAGHEIYVGLFYFKSKHYKAALKRFKALVSNHPDVGAHQKALVYIARLEALLEKRE
ncbi:MAG TPA: outer membrane protein assembly factor BamD [Desulfobacterales bacterium]|nr:outer membrane protein assembly factor BamD [Desulfobacterales bacterium]